MSITESESKRIIIVKPPARVAVDWGTTQWEIAIDVHPDYAADDFDTPIELTCDGKMLLELYPENAEEIGRALIRAAEIRRNAARAAESP